MQIPFDRDAVGRRKASALSRLVVGVAVAVSSGSAMLSGCGSGHDGVPVPSSGLPESKATQAQVLQGRQIVTSFGCVDCHSNGLNNPASSKWMAGYTGGANGVFQIGPFATFAANLTPDKTTGIGGFTDHQVFNALRYGLDPSFGPDAVITSTTPGQGNFPATPHFLAPPMPWSSTRHLSDSDTWALVAYLKHGIVAVSNTVPDSQGPPDFWASSYTDAAIGPAALPDYPTSSEAFSP